MIEVEGLSLKVKDFWLKDINLTVQSGSCHVIIGPTGCGKTTLLEALIGLRKINKGRIRLNGEDITDLPPHKRGFSYVPQDLAIFPHLSVEENIFYGLKHSNLPHKKERYEWAYELIESLGLKPLLKRKSVNLSGGEKQRVALARALAPGHKYLLLDEPLSSLHEGMKKELWFLLKSLQKKYGFTILMVSHDLEETFFLADHISLMIDGMIQQSAPKEIIYHMPATIKIADFFGIKNLFKVQIKKIQGEFASLNCPDLSTELVIPVGRLTPNSQGAWIMVGIRPENVMILRADQDPRGKENLLEGEITNIFAKGSTYLIIFKPKGAQRIVEIEVPNYAYRKLGLAEGQRVVVSLKAETLFLLNS